ncbi:MAG: helix-turn-helix domain-containing protein [Clostridiales bacterium]|nr:helix-turn-helix domain-containing protein [Clostridiales bacterium]
MNGEQIRKARRRFGYTLKDVARMTNLSIGYLSNIERNAASPTVDILEIICNALRLDIVDVIRGDETRPLVVHHDSRVCIYSEQDGILENCASAQSSIKCTCHTMNPNFRGEAHAMSQDNSDLICYVLSGTMEITIDGERFYLEKDDTICIPRHTMHSFHQIGTEVCRSLWIYNGRIPK